MIQLLGDRYSEFIPAEMVAEFGLRTPAAPGVGIGAEVRMQDCWLIIASPLEDSPAFKAGLMPEDRITAINGEHLRPPHRVTRASPASPTPRHHHRRSRRPGLRPHHRAEDREPTVKGVSYAGDGWDFFIDPTRRIAYRA